MMKTDNNKSGFAPVFSFTFKNNVCNHKYITTTAVVSFFIIAVICGLLIFFSKNDEKKIDVDTVYVTSECEYRVPDYSNFAKLAGYDDMVPIEYIKTEESVIDFIKNKEESEEEFLLAVETRDDEGLKMRIVKSDGLELDDEAIEQFAKRLTNLFQVYVYQLSGMRDDELIQAITNADVSVYKLSDEVDGDETKEIVQIVVSMGTLILVYVVTIIFGQQLCADVSSEKTTKLVEQLLMSVTPEGLVSGKIVGTICASAFQLIIWIVSIAIGIFGGDYLGKVIYNNDTGIVGELISIIRDAIDGQSFTVPNIILAIVLAVVGITFYLVLAGVAGSMISKPEEASNVQSIYILPLIISYAILIGAMVSGEGKVPLILNLIPFTSCMSAPAAVIVGNLGILYGILSLVIMIAFELVLFYVASKVYKGMLFFNGTKIKLKELINMLKMK